MTDQHQKLLVILDQITQELQRKALWQDSPPSPEALASTQPFCVDTLTFAEWTQWIMIPRFGVMVHQGHPLPNQSDIFSMAEEALKLVSQDTQQLEALFLELDNCLRNTVH